jgi:hypothetical protein
MFSISELKAVLARLAALALLGILPAWANSFIDAPISCGRGSQYKACVASFDGSRLRIAYTHSGGTKSVAVYSQCAASPDQIHCMTGRWESEIGGGQLGLRSIGLRNGLPISD